MATSNEQSVIKYLKKAGFTVNKWGSAYDRGNFRVYTLDGEVVIITFDSQKTQVIENESTVSLCLPLTKIQQIIEVICC